MSFFAPAALPVNPAWLAILLCGAPIVREAAVGLFTRFDIKADVLVSLALLASVAIGEIFAAGEIAFIMQLGSLLEERTVAYLQDIAANRMGDYKMIAQALGTPGKCESVPACADELRDIMRTLLIRLQAAGEIDPAVSLEYCCTAIFSAVIGGLIGLCYTAECGIQSGLPENLKMLLHRTLQVQR